MRACACSKQLKNLQHFYVCDRCDRGLLKLRHNLCPCDMEKAHLNAGQFKCALATRRGSCGGVACFRHATR